MKKWLLMAVVLLLMTAAGCSSDDKKVSADKEKKEKSTEQRETEQKTPETPAPQTTAPETTAPVGQIPDAKVSYIGSLSDKTVLIGDVLFTMAADTKVTDEKGKIFDVADLEVGQKIKAEFASPLTGTFPQQATLKTLVVYTDKTSTIESMVAGLAIETNETAGTTLVVNEITADKTKKNYIVKLRVVSQGKDEVKDVKVESDQLAIEE